MSTTRAPELTVRSARTRADRALIATDLRDNGLLIGEIAAFMSLARSTVSAYLSDPDGAKARARKHRYRGRCSDCDGPTNGNNGPNAAPTRCARCQREHQRGDEWARRASARKRGKVKHSEEAIVHAIRAASLNGRCSSERYQRHAPPGAPGLSTIIVRYRTWTGAVLAAGLTPTRRAAAPRTDRTTAAQAAQDVATAWQALGHRPSANEYARVSRQLGLRCQATVRRACDGWPSACDAARHILARDATSPGGAPKPPSRPTPLAASERRTMPKPTEPREIEREAA
jgi:hypothetical protein